VDGRPPAVRRLSAEMTHGAPKTDDTDPDQGKVKTADEFFRSAGNRDPVLPVSIPSVSVISRTLGEGRAGWILLVSYLRYRVYHHVRPHLSSSSRRRWSAVVSA